MHKKITTLFLSFIFILLSGCATLNGYEYKTVCTKKSKHGRLVCTKIKVSRSESEGRNYNEKGNASWYGRELHRHRTYSGERFNMYQLTAAHKTLPMATKVQVTNLLNGRKVIVRINDRGPFVPGRLIDLSYAAAKQIGMLGYGTVPVQIKTLDQI